MSGLMPYVSIITLSYNSGESLLLSIDSAFEQNYENVEIIIADDCSKGFSCQEVERYIKNKFSTSKKKLTVKKNDENIGTVKNLNKAINLASGEIIIHLSSGDTFFDHSTVSCIVEKFKEDSCPFIITSRVLVDKLTRNRIRFMPDWEERRNIKRINTPKKQNTAIYTGNFYNMASGAALAYKTEYIRCMGLFDESYVLWEDGPFFEKVTRNGYVLHQNYDLTTICYEGGGISNSAISPLLKRDVIHFLNCGIENHNFTRFERKQIEYRIRSIENYPKKYFDIRFLDVFFYKQFLHIRRGIFKIFHFL